MDSKQVQEIYNNKQIPINGRTYHIGTITFDMSRKAMAYLVRKRGDTSSLISDILEGGDFAPIEKIVKDVLLFEAGQLSKEIGHFDRYPSDYLPLMTTMLRVLAHPLADGATQS